jgi:hypothetical protein
MWRGRIARFYPRRSVAHVVLGVSGAYIALILALVLAMYLELIPRNPDRIEEPIRHSSITRCVHWLSMGIIPRELDLLRRRSVGAGRSPADPTHAQPATRSRSDLKGRRSSRASSPRSLLGARSPEAA